MTRDEVERALTGVVDPELHRNIVELDMVREIRVEGAKVHVQVALTISGCPMKGRIEQDIRTRLGDLPEVEEVTLDVTVMTQEERQALIEKIKGPKPTSPLMDGSAPTKILAVASGKGGVGKSTVTANLAVALARKGFTVGVLDADVWGFSIPRALGLTAKPTMIDKTIIPPEAHGVRIMSMGSFVDEDSPVIWRGPLLGRALEQFLTDVHWGDLDYLLLDLPPGTGDIAISLSQLLPHGYFLLVTTPQAASVHVASRVAHMAKKTGHRLVGLVENMSYFVCPHCEERTEVFGAGGAEALAKVMEVPLLGRIPLEPVVRQGGDEGEPVVVKAPDSQAGKAFLELADQVAKLIPVPVAVAGNPGS
ncbi:MAG: Mrp/NBP35 family ATP-binding protein [Firmicutes bacterium]|nr:Mrp/NBP35 family ATP-binding protein [Bacillota bacterium]